MSSESEGRSDQPEGEAARVAGVAVAAVVAEGAVEVEGGNIRGEGRRSRASYLCGHNVRTTSLKGRRNGEKGDTERRGCVF